MTAQPHSVDRHSITRPRLPLLLGMLAGATVAAQSSDRNLVSNASFEFAPKGKPGHWQLFEGRAKAQFQLDRAAHSGKRAIRIENEAKRAPHVYTYISQTIDVIPNREYTLSCYARSDDAGIAWIGGGKGWKRRFMIPRKTTGWQRVVGTLKTASDEHSFKVMILTESPTPGLWIDDVQFELGGVATPFVAVLPLGPGETRLTLTPRTRNPNLLPNSSFESVHGNRPEEWMFDKRNTDASMTVDAAIAHSGSRSLKFTNDTRFGPHVYAWFGVSGGIAVKPATPYTVSAYVRSENPGTAWIGGAKRWRVRCKFYRTDGKWLRVSKSFVTEADETTIPFMIVTESPTEGLWVDDVKLEEGYEATPYQQDAADDPAIDLAPRLRKAQQSKGRTAVPYWAPSKYPIRECLFTAGELRAEGFAHVPSDLPEGRVRVRLVRENGEMAAEADRAMGLSKGAWRLDFQAHLGADPSGPLTLQAELLDGEQLLARSSLPLRVYTHRGVAQQIGRVEQLAAQLKPLVERLAERRLDAYARVTLTVLRNFLPWAKEDLAHRHVDRAWDAAVVMEQMARRRIEESEAILAGERQGSPVPRYTTQPLRIDGPSFVADSFLVGPKAPPQPRPVFFVGYGHFSQVRSDVEKFPGYGCNMIQIEFGPRSVLPAEGEVSDEAIDAFVAVCKRAEEAGVAVNLLLSPHYFPGWAMEKWPHLKDCTGGFFKYCVHAPESRAIIERSLRRVIPRIKDLPALHSLCLSNEPINVQVAKCPYVRRQWHEWLGRKHGDVARMNERWRTQFKRFEDVDVPEAKFVPGPVTYDFVCFNQEVFAGFHRWMADVIHEMAPRVPVHAKIMMGAHFHRGTHGIWSVSPELFGQLSQISGNDLGWMHHRRGDWNSGWLRANMALDFQRSMADLPVFNSENHLIVDRDHDVIPPDHVYTVLWQEAIHGQSATTIWVWQRTNSYVSSLAGSIIHRPDCTEAAGRACLDLNRLAPQVTAIQNATPEIVLFWSQASVIQGDEHVYALRTAYEALSFLGLPLGFVTERQLARYASDEGIPLPLRAAKVVVVAGATHVPANVLAGLGRFREQGGVVLCVGDCLQSDEYMQTRAERPDFGTPIALPEESRELLRTFEARLPAWGVARRIRLVDKDGQPAWGVELRSARYRNRWIANICNHHRDPQTVRLLLDAKPTAGTDLISGKAADRDFVVDPQVPMLVALPGVE